MSDAPNTARIPHPLLRYRLLLVVALEILAFALSGLLAFLLRFDFHIPDAHQHQLLPALFFWIGIKLVVFSALGLDRGWWRYASIQDLTRLAFGNLAASLIACLAIVAFGPTGVPRSLYLIDLVLSFLLTALLRMATRLVSEWLRPRHPHSSAHRTIIYGAGDAGVSLLRELRQNRALGYQVVGFIDDDPHKRGASILGEKVLGIGEALPLIAAKHRVQTALIAIPSATGPQMTRMLEQCHAAGVTYKTIPGLGEVIEGSALSRQIRDVAVEDLLGRNPVRLEESEIRAKVEGKVVLVTGAAGSIGSELCRQIAKFSPATLVGFEIAESPLFELERELRASHPELNFHPEVGSIQNTARLNDVFQLYGPSIVYHAAAYKHVPMMEAHVFEAVENNIFGTYNVARAAAAHAADEFVLISTDKAVRPTNIMGASKRVAELTLLALQNGGTKFIAVRFGNVLGSNGSVIPIFRKQIAQGGPVTVTHPDMRRFFMTIPEACQLVLQASAMADGGQICVLDMGEPVKIVDLARNLILLSGLRPDTDIKIEFTGARPGEKLYEELSSFFEDTAPTRHEKIHIYMGGGLPERPMTAWLSDLRHISERRDVGALVVALKEMVPDYNPSAHILKRAVSRQPKAAAATAGTAAIAVS